MENPEPQYYQPPENHHDHIHKMVIWLSVFFGSLVLLVILIIAFADRLAKQLPFSAEEQFIRPYEAMAGYFFDEEPLQEEKEIERYLGDLANELALAIDLPENYNLKVHYLDNGTVNALATLGGHIFIFRGLLEAMPDENSLAMVLAHEIAHIKHRDPLAAMGRGFALQMIYSFTSGDYSSGVGLTIEGSEIGLLYFSREQEKAADLLAVDALAKHYGHTAGYATLFEYILSDLDEESVNEDSVIDLEEWLSTHPKLQSRIDAMKNYIEENRYTLEGDASALPVWIESHIKEIKKQKRIKERLKSIEE